METTIIGYIGVIVFPVRFLLSKTGPELLFYYAKFCYRVPHIYGLHVERLHSSSSPNLHVGWGMLAQNQDKTAYVRVWDAVRVSRRQVKLAYRFSGAKTFFGELSHR